MRFHICSWSTIALPKFCFLASSYLKLTGVMSITICLFSHLYWNDVHGRDSNEAHALVFWLRTDSFVL